MPMDRGYTLGCTEECHQSTTSQRSPLDPTDKMMDDRGPVVVLAQALELMSGLDMRKQPPARRGNGLQLNKQRGCRQDNNLIVFLIKSQII